MRNYIFINCMRRICAGIIPDKNGAKREENTADSVCSDRICHKACASLSVEAALVVPVVLFTIMAGLYFFMYLHDKAILTYASNRACLLAVYEEDEEQMCKAVKTIYEEEAAKSLLGLWEIDSEANIDGEYIILSSEAVSKMMKVNVYSKLRIIQGDLM